MITTLVISGLALAWMVYEILTAKTDPRDP